MRVMGAEWFPNEERSDRWTLLVIGGGEGTSCGYAGLMGWRVGLEARQCRLLSTDEGHNLSEPKGPEKRWLIPPQTTVEG